MKTFVLFVLVCAMSCVSAFRICSDPKSHYGTFINNPRAFACSDGTRAQCVSAVFTLCSAPTTSTWIKGTKVNSNCNSIPINTPIASFTGSGGKYNGNNGHAAIFRGCTSDGVRVADQWCGKPGKFSERTLLNKCTSSKPASNCADYFYTIEW